MAEEKSAFEGKKFPPPKEFTAKAYIKSREEYQKMWEQSIKDPDGFWGKVAEEYITWYKKWTKVNEENYKEAQIKWFIGGKLNACYNCLDRHIGTKKENQIALIAEGNDPSESWKYTYKELLTEVSKFANVLKSLGVKKGDRVTIYLPMIPQLAISLLACARIGAIHSIVFGGFSAEALKDRILDCKSKVLVTCDGTFRGAKAVPQKDNADKAVEGTGIEKVVVYKRVGEKISCSWKEGRDLWWDDLMAKASADCPCEEMDAEDPLFILYTSGSTGKPKGVMHTIGGFMVYVSFSHKVIFDYHDGDIYWCTADIGWVTGHSYIVYGPLANGATSIMFEGVPSYPDWGRFWDVVDKYKVNIIYTAPTAIRAIAKEGLDWVKKHDLSSLKLLGTVGEPINPEAWGWYHVNIGKEKCPIVDTWWQTETGGILITPLPGAWATKPGSATLPFFGVEPCLLDANGKELEGPGEGALCIKRSWPGQMRGVYGDPKRYKETYFVQFPGYYFSGDGARRDEDGYYWITGRVDDVINVSGHRMGTAEVESALVAHPQVAEAAVVGFPHDIKGQGIYAYVTLNSGVPKSDELKKELVGHVRKLIGPIATPDKIQFADGLPKTRSGKIMRRILRKIAENQPDQVGDTSTLADPHVVEDLITNRVI
jgi:acetyl-CoA synthetase